MSGLLVGRDLERAKQAAADGDGWVSAAVRLSSELNEVVYQRDKSTDSAEKATAERIAAWLKDIKEHEAWRIHEQKHLLTELANRIREGEWKR